MKSFARVTKLSSIGGRASYITDEKRQECILAESAPVDWTPYHQFEQSHQRTDTANNEGREVIVALPNEWAKLSSRELETRAQALAETAAGKKTDMQWAVHWNKGRTNLHMHVIFSERQRDGAAGVYDRDIYHTADGKVARRKADRAKNPDGTDKPPVHRKGESRGGFTAKDVRYKSRSWVAEVKDKLREQLRGYGVQIEKPAALHQYHEGKGRDAPAIRAKNGVIRQNNRLFDAYCRKFPDFDRGRLKAEFVKASRKGCLLSVRLDGTDGRYHLAYVTPERAEEIRRKAVSAERITAAAPAPERPAFSLDALIAAQREVYHQTFALHDERRPADKEILALPGRVKGMAAEVEAALSAKESTLRELSSCGVFEFARKKAAKADYEAASVRFDTAVKALSPYCPRLEASRAMGADVVRSVMADGLKAAENAARQEMERARPESALKGSPEATRTAVERFKALAREIPAELRESCVHALEDDLRATPDFGSRAADLRARAQVREIQRSISPEVKRQEQERNKSRSKGHER